jgi:hypothetical protein
VGEKEPRSIRKLVNLPADNRDLPVLSMSASATGVILMSGTKVVWPYKATE